MKKKNKIRVGFRYRLHAPWHAHHMKEVIVIQSRKGLSPSHEGKTVFHIGTDPDDPDFFHEDLDTEHVEHELHDIGFEESSKPFDIEADEDTIKTAGDEMGIEILFFKNNAGDRYIGFKKKRFGLWTVKLDALHMWLRDDKKAAADWGGEQEKKQDKES